MACTPYQFPPAASGTSAAPTCSFLVPTAVGSTLFAFVTSSQPISAPAGWSTAFNQSGPPNLACFYLENAASVSTVAAGLGGSAGWVIVLYEVAGLQSSASLGPVATTSGPGSGQVLTLASCLVLAALATATVASYSAPTGGFAIINQGTYNSLGTLSLCCLFAIGAGVGDTYVTSVTSSGAAPSVGGIVAFRDNLIKRGGWIGGSIGGSM